jgi:adenylosuccinate lyase
MPAKNYHYSLRKNPEERISHAGATSSDTNEPSFHLVLSEANEDPYCHNL